LSWLPFCFGALANLLGGVASDRMIHRLGLKWGRRVIGLTGLGAAAVFTLAAIAVENKIGSVSLLALGYAGSDFMLPGAWAVCLDVGRKHAGAITAAMNTAGQLGSFLTSVAFGYLVKAYGSYDAPLVPMAVMLLAAAALWLRIDPTEKLADEPDTGTAL